jgi:hypothetical protein
MASMSALESIHVLQLVFQYAGDAQWLFLGGVCKSWAAVVLQERTHDDTTTVTAAAQAKTTRFGAVAMGCSICCRVRGTQ